MKERERKRKRETVRKRDTQTRMLNVIISCTLHTLKKMGNAGIIIALEQHGVRVKEKDGEKRLCKRWCVMNKRQTLRFILSPLCGLYLQRLLALYDVLQSLQISGEKLVQTTLERVVLKSVSTLLNRYLSV